MLDVAVPTPTTPLVESYLVFHPPVHRRDEGRLYSVTGEPERSTSHVALVSTLERSEPGPGTVVG